MTTTPIAPGQRYIDIPGAALWLACSEQTIRRRISEGEIRAFRLGRGKKAHIRIPVEELDRLLEPVPTTAHVGQA